MLILSGAYGRDYDSQKMILQHFYDKKDFIIRNAYHPYEGKPINVQDTAQGDEIEFRYSSDSKAFIHKVI